MITFTHLVIYTYIKSLCCTPETNTMLYINYISIKTFIIFRCTALIRQDIELSHHPRKFPPVPSLSITSPSQHS